tara:strand:+ start:936 stop:1187 length:252 start_codon:yes stop_codon:yes gene_type:complete
MRAEIEYGTNMTWMDNWRKNNEAGTKDFRYIQDGIEYRIYQMYQNFWGTAQRNQGQTKWAKTNFSGHFWTFESHLRALKEFLQ